MAKIFFEGEEVRISRLGENFVLMNLKGKDGQITSLGYFREET